MSPVTRKRLFDALRLLLCVAALWFVMRGVTLNDQIVLRENDQIKVGQVIEVDAEELTWEEIDGQRVTIPIGSLSIDKHGRPLISYGLRSTWQNSRKELLLLAVLIHFPVIFLQAARFKWMVEAQRIALSYWDSLKLSFAGNFLNFVTPLGSNAGDVFKAYFLALHTAQKTEAVTTVFLDRVVGLCTMVLVTAGIVTLAPDSGPLAVVRPYILLMLGIGIVAMFAYFAPPLRRLIPVGLLDKLPMADQIRRIDGAARTLMKQKKVVLACVLITFLLQVWAIAAYFTVAVALEMHANLSNIFDYYACFYTGVVVQSLPGPPQGLGTVELTYRFFFDRFGSPSQIVCLAFGIRMVGLICALPGVLVTMTGAYRPRGAVEHAVLREPAATRPDGPKSI